MGMSTPKATSPYRVLVTGSNGLLGQKLIALLAGMPQVQLLATSIGPNRHTPAGQGYTYQSLDITQPQAVMQCVASFKPHAVIHAAAMTQVDGCEDDKPRAWLLNVTAVENMVVACQAHNAFLVHLSTDFIFDGTKGPYAETHAPQPVNYYGMTKLAAENVVLQSGLPAAIARTILVYGYAPNMGRSNIVLWVKNSLEAGKQINVVTDQWRTPTLAEDLAQGCWLLAQQQAAGTWNISGPEPLLSPYDMAQQVALTFGLDAALIYPTNGTKFQQKAKRPPKTGLIINKAVQQLGYQPHSFAQGLQLTAKLLPQGPAQVP